MTENLVVALGCGWLIDFNSTLYALDTSFKIGVPFAECKMDVDLVCRKSLLVTVNWDRLQAELLV